MNNKKIFISTILAVTAASFSFAQVRVVNSNTLVAASNSSAFIDASSDEAINKSSFIGKGLLFPTTDLSTFTEFGNGFAPIGLSSNYPTYYDGMIVYNTKDGGTAGIGKTQGTLKPGYWYYENSSKTIGGGTWKQVSSPTSNLLASNGNLLTSTVNGVSSAATPIINSLTNTISGNQLTTTINGISATVNLPSAAPTTNVITRTGNTITSNVNGVSSSVDLPPAALTTNVITRTGNTITSNVNGVSSSVDLPPSANIAASNGLIKAGNDVKLGGTLIENTTINGTSTINIPQTNGLAIGSTGQVAGAKLLVEGGALQVGGQITNKAGGLQVRNQDALKPVVTMHSNSNNELFRLNEDGNVGIGTSSPTSKLDVEGAVRIRQTQLTAFGSDDRILAIEPNGYVKKVNVSLGVDNPANNGLSKDGSTIQLGGVLNKKTNIDNFGNDFNINGAGTVGIGTWKPVGSSKLNIQGGPLNIGDLESYSGGLQVVNQNASRPIARFYSSDNVERVTLGEGGNVGIGTNQPTQKLDIDGSIRIRDTKLMPIDDNDRLLAIEPNGYVKKVNIARVINVGNFSGGINVNPSAGATQVTTLNITVPAGMKYRVLLNMKLQLQPAVWGNFYKGVNGTFSLADNTTNIHFEFMGAGTIIIPAAENNGQKFYGHNLKDTTISHVYEINNENGSSAITKTLYFRYNPGETNGPNADKRHNFQIKGTFTTFEMP